ncbi:hypothetical protein V494_05682 [Pseudogymnoascus sp. VKM F-4513 (FW-928)]|nr:hypothetical protein V494_05682 [Pseudogymnoascus sp. VKM F-4513 (FW-928)]
MLLLLEAARNQGLEAPHPIPHAVRHQSQRTDAYLHPPALQLRNLPNGNEAPPSRARPLLPPRPARLQQMELDRAGLDQDLGAHRRGIAAPATTRYQARSSEYRLLVQLRPYHDLPARGAAARHNR